MRDGQPMSSALRQHTVFPAMVTQMIEVGEESGQISQMLDKIADFYDREVDSAAESLTASIEPIMVLVMGAVVGGMVVCLYLPMFSIYQNIQARTDALERTTGLRSTSGARARTRHPAPT